MEYLLVVFVFVGFILQSNGQKLETLGNRLKDYRDHECVRPCVTGAVPKVCKYELTVEIYHTLSKACHECPFNITDCFRPHCVPADGFQKSILTYNRQIPGPAIQVCLGDTVEVRVRNQMPDASTTIHWHGIHQRGTPYMDGTPMITQCPIHPFTSFTYKFEASPSGTHYYHSHSGFQRTDGLAGAFIVREPADPSRDLYYYDLPEHVLLIEDWQHMLTQTMFTGHHHGNRFIWNRDSDTLLVNGLGRNVSLVDEQTTEFFTPRAVFRVEVNLKYRFRLISNGNQCTFRFSIDGHVLLVIASDGRTVEPFETDSLLVQPGERYDIVLHANHSTPANFWIRVFGEPLCHWKSAHQEAILRYIEAPETDPPGDTDYASGRREGVTLNVFGQNLAPERIPLIHLNSSEPDDPNDKWNQTVADVIEYISFDFMLQNAFPYHDPDLYPVRTLGYRYSSYVAECNEIFFQTPPAPLLTQYKDVPENLFCNYESIQGLGCEESYCECIHRLKVGVGEVMELVLIELGVLFDATHSFHLHGGNFRVVAMEVVNTAGVTRQEIIDMDQRGEIKRKLDKAPIKDTVVTMDGGYVILRFHATNPGFWLFHCHYNFHQRIGMALVIQVGEPEDFPKKPKNFPTCGNFEYEGEEEEEEEEETQCSASYFALNSGLLITAIGVALFAK